jgi:hypothetical protein
MGLGEREGDDCEWHSLSSWETYLVVFDACHDLFSMMQEHFLQHTRYIFHSFFGYLRNMYSIKWVPPLWNLYHVERALPSVIHETAHIPLTHTSESQCFSLLIGFPSQFLESVLP